MTRATAQGRRESQSRSFDCAPRPSKGDGKYKNRGAPLRMTGAEFPAQAKKKLIATHANSEFALTNWNHSLLTISNRNTNPYFCLKIFSAPLHPKWNRRVCHRCQSANRATPRPSNPTRPVLQWMIRARYRVETAAGAAASKDLEVGKRETE
jgi:hypothetical protein